MACTNTSFQIKEKEIFGDKICTCRLCKLDIFGDGCAAIAMRADSIYNAMDPQRSSFESHIIPDTWRAMSYHRQEEHQIISFHFGP